MERISSKIREILFPGGPYGTTGMAHDNFIRTSRYLNKEIGHIPEEKLKKYDKGVLNKA